ncbi:hypothetical protein [Pseudomonas gingeri]|uniref:hypothetical protein n=1 Tax=Pseudomonas gingeri TaxID=117681 RepID=UPI0015A4899A|nr:hypothetical protein [Pseudomonas gingeri]NWA09695.1 hypothetical protein [Pseudomonas gingeri]
MSIDLLAWFSDPKNWIAIAISAPIAIFALCVALMNYRRKSGIFVRGDFTISTSIDCNDSYISNIMLENMKDRALTIYNIFLKIDHNYYLEVENHEEKPVILKAYETYNTNLGEILFYGVNMRKIKIEKLMRDRKIKKRLVLSTSEGKYTVPAPIRRWSPLSELFSNYFTGLIQPVVATYKGKYIGENIQFIIDMTYKNDTTSTILIRKNDYPNHTFKKFELTKETLKTKETLENFLEQKRAEGALQHDTKFEVHDFEEYKLKTNEQYQQTPINAEKYSAFRYYILGRLNTFRSNYFDKK